MTTQRLAPADVPDRLAGFFAPPYDDSRRYCWDLARDGGRRLAVSEGRMLLAVDVPADAAHKLPDCIGEPPDPWPLLDAPAAEGTQPLTVSVAALLEWCGPEPAAEQMVCEDCRGNGECECPCCYDVHVCKSCKGTRWSRKPREPLHGRLLGQRVDRHRLRRLLSTASGQCVVTLRRRADDKRGPIDFVRLDGDGWTACLMPLVEDASKPCPASGEEAPCRTNA